jgi:LysR family hydrogen peroxide-inducible transcriptional activator
MTLTQLRYISALAREEHFGRAARTCFVSQPTLSVAVRKLEDELGLSLFERQSNRVVPTAAGRAILAQANRVLAEAARVKELAHAGQDQLAGELRIGAIFTVGPYVLPFVIPRLRRLAPNMPLVIEENYTHRLTERLRAGELDVIIAALPLNESAVITWPLYEEPFSVLLPIGHPLSRKKTVRAEDLSDQNMLLLGDGHCFRDQVLSACPECLGAESAVRPARATEGSSLETIRQMVASGLGVTVVPVTSMGRWAGVRSEGRLLTEKLFDGRSPQRTIALAWRGSFPRPDAIKTLRRAVLECHLRGVNYLDFQAPMDSETGNRIEGWVESRSKAHEARSKSVL